jgi:DNA-binding PadR family transcriptional regulator
MSKLANTHGEHILALLVNSDVPLTANELYINLKKVSPKITVGAVYRALSGLMEEGWIITPSVGKSANYHLTPIGRIVASMADLHVRALEEKSVPYWLTAKVRKFYKIARNQSSIEFSSDAIGQQ